MNEVIQIEGVNLPPDTIGFIHAVSFEIVDRYMIGIDYSINLEKEKEEVEVDWVKEGF